MSKRSKGCLPNLADDADGYIAAEELRRSAVSQDWVAAVCLVAHFRAKLG